MKLKEFGFIILQLTNEKIDSEIVGNLSWKFSHLIEDWDKDCNVEESKDWILENIREKKN